MSCETLQNLPYFWNAKTEIVFVTSNFGFLTVDALVYFDIDHGIHLVKIKVTRNVKCKKLCGFLYSKNMANSEAFC